MGTSPRLGPIGYGSDGPAYLSGSPFGQERPFAEGTQQAIDEEVTRLLREAESTAHSLLSENSAALQAVIGALLEKETLSGEDFVEIVKRAQQSRNGSEPPGKSTGSSLPLGLATHPYIMPRDRPIDGPTQYGESGGASYQ